MVIKINLCSAAVLLLALLGGVIWNSLPCIIGYFVSSNITHHFVEKLRIGHQMLGGGVNANEALGSAMKSKFLTKLFGVKSTDSRVAWREFVEAITEAESEYVSPVRGFGMGPADKAAVEVAEGLRYVAHVTKLALDLYLEPNPRLVRAVGPNLKLLGDNPDAIYYLAHFPETGKAWNVRGCRGAEEVYFSFTIHAPIPGNAPYEQVVQEANDETIIIDNEGCYSIILSREDPGIEGSTWIELPDDATTLITRHYFDSSAPAALHQQVNISIAAMNDGSDSIQRGPPDDAVIAQRIRDATLFIRMQTVLMKTFDPAHPLPFFSLIPNEFGVPHKWSREWEGLGAVDIHYSGGVFRLDSPDDVLVITGTMPKCRFANVVFWNRFLQTFDYSSWETHPVHLNLNQVARASEKFTLVVSATRPTFDGKFHWIFTEGREMGSIFFRFLLASDVEQPRTDVVQMKNLESHLNELNNPL